MKKLIALLATTIMLLPIWCHAEEPVQVAPKKPLVVLVPDTIDYYNQGFWEELGKAVISVDTDTIVLNVRGYGGDPLILMTLVSYMDMAKQLGKKIIVNVVGPAASAHAFLVCQADNVGMNSGTTLYFHQAYSTESFFFGFFLISNTDASAFYTATLNRLEQDCVKHGILTQTDLDHMHNGQAIIIHNIDNNIVKIEAQDESTNNINHNLTNIAKLIVFLTFVACLIVGYRRLK